MRNGEPFYIRGGAASGAYLEELKEAGANTARIYDTINLKEVLNQAEALGLAVVVDIPMPKFVNAREYYEDPELFSELKKNVERAIREHKDHPALLYWNLGNELYYPYFYKRTKFHSSFNQLIDLIHKIDPNHPVSTTTIGANKLRVLSIINKSPQLDFISFNSFGTLSQFYKKLRPLAPIWSGPHVITEWGVNGPWEAKKTAWGVPIEETSTKKAEQIQQRHRDYIVPLRSKNSLGSFVFYWGHKNEVTPTWYSLFGENKKKTQAVHELSTIWNRENTLFTGPQLEYLLLNDQGALESVILQPETFAQLEVVLPGETAESFDFIYEVRYESWHTIDENTPVENIEFKKNDNKVFFKTPEKEGPYRIFAYLFNGTEYMATANFPFYVLNPRDGSQN